MTDGWLRTGREGSHPQLHFITAKTNIFIVNTISSLSLVSWWVSQQYYSSVDRGVCVWSAFVPDPVKSSVSPSIASSLCILPDLPCPGVKQNLIMGWRRTSWSGRMGGNWSPKRSSSSVVACSECQSVVVCQKFRCWKPSPSLRNCNSTFCVTLATLGRYAELSWGVVKQTTLVCKVFFGSK